MSCSCMCGEGARVPGVPGGRWCTYGGVATDSDPTSAVESDDPWVPKVGDTVLVEAKVEGLDFKNDWVGVRIRGRQCVAAGPDAAMNIRPTSLRPLPEGDQ